jgi:hypothetical protein
MVVFSMLKVVIVEWDIVRHTEVMAILFASFRGIKLINY